MADEKNGRIADRAAEAGHRQRARAGVQPAQFSDVKDHEKFFAETAPRVRGIAVCRHVWSGSTATSCRGFRGSRSCRSFGVGYDHVDATWAGAHGITVTNTPDVLTEEVADTALGLLLCTVREFPQAERYLRAGKWRERAYPLTKATLRDRTVGMVGMGAHRPGDRAPARGHAGAGGLSFAAAGGGRVLPALSEAHRHGARRRHAAGHHAGRRRDQEPDQCRGAQGARAGRHPHQHGARLGGRRAGADQGARGQDHHVGRSRRLSRTSPRCRKS